MEQKHIDSSDFLLSRKYTIAGFLRKNSTKLLDCKYSEEEISKIVLKLLLNKPITVNLIQNKDCDANPIGSTLFGLKEFIDDKFPFKYSGKSLLLSGFDGLYFSEFSGRHYNEVMEGSVNTTYIFISSKNKEIVSEYVDLLGIRDDLQDVVEHRNSIYSQL